MAETKNKGCGKGTPIWDVLGVSRKEYYDVRDLMFEYFESNRKERYAIVNLFFQNSKDKRTKAFIFSMWGKKDMKRKLSKKFNIPLEKINVEIEKPWEKINVSKKDYLSKLDKLEGIDDRKWRNLNKKICPKKRNIIIQKHF